MVTSGVHSSLGSAAQRLNHYRLLHLPEMDVSVLGPRMLRSTEPGPSQHHELEAWQRLNIGRVAQHEEWFSNIQVCNLYRDAHKGKQDEGLRIELEEARLAYGL